MIGFISAGLVFLACLGSGAVILRLLGLLNGLASRERPAWSFAVGFGFVGWLMFFLAYGGWLQTEVQAVLLAFLATGSFLLLVAPASEAEDDRLNGAGRWFLLALLVALAFDWVEALAPPADADSLAYHFALPKQFLAAGHLQFVPRAVDGAVPLLAEMTFLPALALGGEQGLTFWTMLSGWMTAVFVYVLCRRYLEPAWSLGAALVFLTTPAVVYGGGSGHVEVRLALFALAAAFALAEAVKTGDGRFAVLAGLMAGFYAGGKYIGLLFVAACGLALLPQRRWFTHGLLLSVAAVVAGFQWYAWNWINAGDPVFPMLFDWLGAKNGFWDQAHAAAMQSEFFAMERDLPLSPAGFLLYPWAATFGTSERFESLRTGFGPFLLLVLPFAVASAWTYRTRLLGSRLAPVVAIAFLFYALWYFTGSSQRVRHLLPIYPLLLICLLVPAARWASEVSAAAPLAVALALTALLQLGGQAIFSLNYWGRLLKGESREEFYVRQVGSAEVAFWVNGALDPGSRILHNHRVLNYLLNVPYYYAAKPGQALVDLSADADPESTWRQMTSLGITHVLLTGDSEAQALSHWPPAKALMADGCARIMRTFSYEIPLSRTLAGLGRSPSQAVVLSVLPGTCLP